MYSSRLLAADSYVVEDGSRVSVVDETDDSCITHQSLDRAADHGYCTAELVDDADKVAVAEQTDVDNCAANFIGRLVEVKCEQTGAGYCTPPVTVDHQDHNYCTPVFICLLYTSPSPRDS